MAQKEGINTPLVIVVAAVSCVLLVVIVFAVQGWFQYEEQVELDAKWNDPMMADTTASDRKAEQLKSINEKHWVDQSKGITTIPIDDAMRILVENNGKVPWQANPQK